MKTISLAIACLLAASVVSQASTLTADIVLSYKETKVDAPSGPQNGLFDGEPNGLDSTAPDVEYERVDLNIGTVDTTTVTGDGSAGTYVSLPFETEIVLGFSQGFVFNGTGDDLFIQEIGSASESAQVYISQDFGSTFSFLATANQSNTTNSFDFATLPTTSAIADTLKVNAVKIIGNDNRGSSPGFDLGFVKGLEGSVVEEPQIPPAIPLPATAWLMIAGLGGLGLIRRRK